MKQWLEPLPFNPPFVLHPIGGEKGCRAGWDSARVFLLAQINGLANPMISEHCRTPTISKLYCTAVKPKNKRCEWTKETADYFVRSKLHCRWYFTVTLPHLIMIYRIFSSCALNTMKQIELKDIREWCGKKCARVLSAAFVYCIRISAALNTVQGRRHCSELYEGGIRQMLWCDECVYAVCSNVFNRHARVAYAKNHSKMNCMENGF